MLNENYFLVPNKENCFWAGFISKNAELLVDIWFRLYLSFKLEDKTKLEGLCEAINLPKNNIKKIGNRYCLSILSTKLCGDLWHNFNVTTSSREIPDLKKELLLHFFKGEYA